MAERASDGPPKGVTPALETPFQPSRGLRSIHFDPPFLPEIRGGIMGELIVPLTVKKLSVR
ncbi:MAG: hypothetical protein IPJ01_12835 [Micavibrio sp.]|nr:hypothetical protein [Micavibrio sp.]